MNRVSDDRSAFGESLLGFNSLTNSGGFLTSFSSHDESLSDVADQLEGLGLPGVAAVVRAGIDILPPGASGDRSSLIDNLPTVLAEQLEQLGNRYLELVPDNLDERIAAYWAANPGQAPPDVPRGRIPDEVGAVLQDYYDTAARWADMSMSRVAAANALSKRNHKLYQRLRTSKDGRDGIAALMEDENLGVRLVAATHSLGWEPTKATEVLERIEAGPGLHAIDAKYTLKAFREGSLNLDW